jgi:hypothetical protein
MSENLLISILADDIRQDDLGMRTQRTQRMIPDGILHKNVNRICSDAKAHSWMTTLFSLSELSSIGSTVFAEFSSTS